MVLGYEQPVDIPVMSIYDKDMMKMYLNALREDYNQGVKEQEEFNKLAADFTSPIGKDNQRWYDITTKPIVDFLNQNPDAIRSVEGRSKIRQFINSRPYGEMANMRQSAANAKLFDAARQKMIADGTYSDDMAKFFNEDFSNWSTAENGVWGKVAPTKYVGMEDALLPTIQMLQKSYRLDEKASKNRPGYNVFNVSEQQAREAINRNYVDLMTIPAMKYHLAKSGLTEDQFKDLLTKQALAQTPEKLEADQWALLQAKLAAEAAENAKNRAHQRAMAKDKDKEEKQPTPQLTDKINQRTFEKISTVHAPQFVRYMEQRAAKATKPEEKKMFQGFADEWRKFNSLNYQGKVDFLNKYKYLNGDGTLSDKYFTWYGMANGWSRGAGALTRRQSKENAAQYYNSYLADVSGAEESQTLIGAVTGTYQKQKNGYYGVSFGGKVSYTPVRALQVSGHDKMVKTATGHGPSNSVEYKFGDFLKKNHIHGNVYDTTGLRAGRLSGNVLEVSGMRISVPISQVKSFVKTAQSKGYMLSTGKNAKNATAEEIYKDLGVTFVTPEGHDVTVRTAIDGDEKKQSITTKNSPLYYAVIDASATLNADGTSLSALNDSYNKMIGGTGMGGAEVSNSQVSAEAFLDPNGNMFIGGR